MTSRAMNSAPYSSLLDRVVLITGGSRGLGREMALALADAGAIVIVTGTADSRALQESVSALRQRTGPSRALGLVGDVRRTADCTHVVTKVIEVYGALHVLINNAGLGMEYVSKAFITEPPKFWQIAPSIWNDIVETNINGVFNMTRAVVSHMIAREFGKLVNISTSQSTMNRRGRSPYGPTKAAIEVASKIWAQDLQGTGVDVNIYLPGGASDTDMIPRQRGKPGTIANLLPASVIRRGIKWLCADESNGCTGGRYVARLWDEALSPNDAAAKALSMTD